MNRHAYLKKANPISARRLLGDALRETEIRLREAGIPDARIEADLMWMTALQASRAELYLRTFDVIETRACAVTERLVRRRLRREPAAYLLGHREFYGIDLHVRPGVLIPRPDTEILVEETLRVVTAFPTTVSIADVGCGTGAIAIALAKYLSDARIYALELSDSAIEVARFNFDLHGLSGRVNLLKGDLLKPLPRRMDLVVANLPYVKSAEISGLEPEIRLYEPIEALDGGEDGLDMIRNFLTQVPRYLNPRGIVLMEMDPRQMQIAAAFASRMLNSAQIRFVSDLANRPRVLVVEQGV